jgi:hypothetical protein
MSEQLPPLGPRRGAFGLPDGTIRAILALLVILTVCTCVLMKIPLPDWFVGLAGQVVIFYYWRERDKHSG